MVHPSRSRPKEHFSEVGLGYSVSQALIVSRQQAGLWPGRATSHIMEAVSGINGTSDTGWGPAQMVAATAN